MKVTKTFAIDLDVAQALQERGGSFSEFINRVARVALKLEPEAEEEPELKKSGHKVSRKDFRKQQAALSKRGGLKHNSTEIAEAISCGMQIEALEQGLQSIRNEFDSRKKITPARLQYVHTQINKLCEENSLTGNELVSKAFGDEVPTQFKQFARQLAAGH